MSDTKILQDIIKDQKDELLRYDEFTNTMFQVRPCSHCRFIYTEPCCEAVGLPRSEVCKMHWIGYIHGWKNEQIDGSNIDKIHKELVKADIKYWYCEECSKPLYMGVLHEDAVKSELWQEDNSGRTLCIDCAKKQIDN